MNTRDISEQQKTNKKSLFSEEEIHNISALVVVLKQIRKRLLSEGVDIDNYKKHLEITPALEK